MRSPVPPGIGRRRRRRAAAAAGRAPRPAPATTRHPAQPFHLPPMIARDREPRDKADLQGLAYNDPMIPAARSSARSCSARARGVPRARAQDRLRLQVYASGFTAPVAFVQDPLDRSVQFVVEQAGRIRVVRSGTVQPTDFLDLRRRARRRRARTARTRVRARRGERPLLRQLHRSFRRTVVARFRRSADPLVADPASRFDLRFGGATGPP